MKRTEFDRIYETYVDLSHSIAYHVLKDYHLAMDVSQELFVSLYKKMDELDEDLVKYWITKNSRRIAIDHWRKLQKTQTISLDTNESIDEEWALDVESYVEKQQRQDELEKFKGNLFEALVEKDPEMYDVVTKLMVDEENPKEVAEKKGITIGNLRTRLYRAKKWMRKQFGDEYYNL